MTKSLKFLLFAFIVIVSLLLAWTIRVYQPAPPVLLAKPAPDMAFPLLNQPDQIFTPSQMLGKVWIFHVWGAWCPDCQAEYPAFSRLVQQANVTSVGLTYHDEKTNSQQFLQEAGNFFDILASDEEGLSSGPWGIRGIPDTFIIDKTGVVRFSHVGSIDDTLSKDILLPLIAQLQAE